MAEDRFIRLPEVSSLVGMSRATIYRYAKTGGFPQPIKIWGRMSLWSALEIQGWMEERKAEAAGGSALGGGGGE
jgi:prophage regulatory protein